MSSTGEEKRVFHLMVKSFSRTLECRVCQRVLRTSADRVLWNKDWSDLQRSIVGFEQIFSDKMAWSLASYAPVAYQMHAVLLSFSKECKKRFI